MKVIHGDILKLADEGLFDVIIHGCNCYNVFGEGLAKQIKLLYPKAYNVDLMTVKGSSKKLGNYTSSIQQSKSGTFVIVNGYTQYYYGRDRDYCDYEAIDNLFVKIKRDFSGLRIAYPRIGAGYAGGNWSKIYSIICNRLEGEDHTLVEYLK